MTYEYPESSAPSTSGGSSTAQTARDETSDIAQNAAQSTQHLAGEAKSQVKDVAAEAGRQGKDLLDQGRSQLTAQASEQKTRAAGGIRTFGSQLEDMAGAAEGGLAADVTRTVAQRTSGLATWLDEREPADLIEEIKAFARRRPGTFLAIAAGAGLLAGRLTRGVKDSSGGSTGQDTSATHRAPGAPSTPATVAGAGSVAGGTYAEPTAGTSGTGSSASGSTGTATYGTSGTGYGTGTDTYGSGTVGGPAPVTGTAPTTPLDEGYGTATGDPTSGVEAEENR